MHAGQGVVAGYSGGYSADVQDAGAKAKKAIDDVNALLRVQQADEVRKQLLRG